jgi:hypothetical protein
MRRTPAPMVVKSAVDGDVDVDVGAFVLALAVQ